MRSGTASPRSPRAPASPAFSPRTNPSNSRPIPEDSSADEMTGIMSRGSDLNYQALNSANFNGSVARSRKASARGSRRSRPASQQSDAYQPGLNMGYARETQLDGRSPSWWKSQLEKFQSVELENTGSVARDHLAIGTVHPTPVPPSHLGERHTDMLICRANIPRLATNVARIRFHRYRRHPALPTQHISRIR